MSYLLFLLGVCFLVGSVGVAANPSPYFGVVGLVVGVVGGVGGLVMLGGSFIGIVLFLIYLGGMLVVFAYSVALVADPFPETWGSDSVFVRAFVVWAICFFSCVGCGGCCWPWMCGLFGLDGSGLYGLRGDFGGCGSVIFCLGGPFLVLGGWGLMLTLFVVLELVRGWSWGGLRVP
uniref:NADH-ubiquinone oxidoreductase chain 6 n=1 Tax=Cyrtodactylus auribalteatus TaxID=2002801 RepID=A0A3G9E9E7_9SAUR|nr:NADH dehydrogenase subunit 6 [Cyrtodactylus auribalteatus]